MAKSKNQNQSLADMTPDQIRERGKELLRLAQQREVEIRNRQLVRLGEIFLREIRNGWAAPWPALQVELQDLLGVLVEQPAWGFYAGGQGGAAPLATAEMEVANGEPQ